MERKGTIVSVTSEDYHYDIKEGTITLHRYLVVVRLTDGGQLVEGKVDSQNAPPGPVQGWTPNTEVDFVTEVKTTKNNKTYNKFKKPPKENFRGSGSGGRKPMTAEVKAQITRNVATQCAIWLHEAGIGKDRSFSAFAGEIYNHIVKTIPTYVTDTIDADQASMGVQGAIKLAASGAVSLEVSNGDHFFKVADSIIKYIMNG